MKIGNDSRNRTKHITIHKVEDSIGDKSLDHTQGDIWLASVHHVAFKQTHGLSYDATRTLAQYFFPEQP